MLTALKIIMILFGIAAIAIGLKSISRREAKFSWGDDGDEERVVVEGVPAILVGIVEVAIGIFMIVFQRHPWSS